jgi:hypothetical protein
MCACRLQAAGSTPTTPVGDFDDYIPLIMADQLYADGDDLSPGGEEDVYSQLAQKDRDLTLAAELGKALLERNQELQRKHEKMVDGYTHKLEVIMSTDYSRVICQISPPRGNSVPPSPTPQHAR